MYRYLFLAWVAAYLVPIPARAGAISVSPNSGSTGTHFILSVGGWSRCTGGGCSGQITVRVGNRFVYSQTGVEPFSVDLSQLDPDGSGCASCLPNGTHTVRVEGFHECSPSCHVSETLCTTFTIVDSSAIGDPWIIRPFPPTAVGTPGDTFSFIPQATTGFPSCDAVQLIQVVRQTGFYVTSSPRFLTTREQVDLYPGLPPSRREWADSLDAWTTPAHHHVDVGPRAWKQPYVSDPLYYPGAKVGRTGATRDTARFLDAPLRVDVVYPDSVVKIVLDLELNAFCTKGSGQGQYLGRCTWQWERTKGSINLPFGRVNFVQTDLGQPSAAFKDALDRYVTRTRFPLPKAIHPTKGGSPCQ